MEQTFLIWVVIIPDLKRITFAVVCQRDVQFRVDRTFVDDDDLGTLRIMRPA